MTRAHPQVVLLGINYPPEPTGISPYTGALASGLTRRGYPAAAITTHPHYPDWRVRDGYGQWTRHDLVDGVPVRRLRHFVPRRPRGVARAISELSFGLRLALTPWGKPDAVVAVSPALFSSAVAAFRAGLTHRDVPFIVWVQDLYTQGMTEFQGKASLFVRGVRAVERWLLQRADRVVVIHDRFVPRVRDDLGVSADRIAVIRNWAHLAPMLPADIVAVRASLGWAEDETVVLHSGNMGMKQGLENVIEAARMADERQERVRFVLMGDGSARATLQKLGTGVHSLSLLPPLDDAGFAAALQAADVLLVNERPGVAEMAVPSKLTSYFSAGRPVLAATDPDGITAEEIRNAGAGVIVPAGDPSALLDGAMTLAADTNRCALYGRSALEYRQTVLSADFAIDTFARLIDAACESGSEDNDDASVHSRV